MNIELLKDEHRTSNVQHRTLKLKRWSDRLNLLNLLVRFQKEKNQLSHYHYEYQKS